jgi:hypothetical protein
MSRPPRSIENHPQRFEIAAWWAFHEDGCGPLFAARERGEYLRWRDRGSQYSTQDVEGA